MIIAWRFIIVNIGGNVHDAMDRRYQKLSRNNINLHRNQLFPALTTIRCLRVDGAGLIPIRKH